MEIKETKKNSHNWIKELIIILVGVLILSLVSLRTDAAEIDWNGVIVYDNTEYKYYYCDHATAVYSNGSHSITFDKNVYIIPFKHVNGGNVELYVVSNEPFNYTTSNMVNGNHSILKSGTSTIKSVGNKQLYIYNYTMSYGQSNYPAANMYNFNGNLIAGIVNTFYQYFAGDDFVGYQPPTEEIDMSLTGFECNKDMEAFWTGISGLSGYAPGELVVEVKPSYVLMLEEGEELQPFEKPDVINVPFENMSFSNTYDYYFENNPYKGRAILTLNFTPVFSPVQTNPVVLRGKTIKVTFDKNGEFGGYDIPVDGLVPEYSDIEFVLNNFNALSEVNQGEHIINCMWNGSSIDGLIDYVYSEIKVEIYCMDKEDGSWKWLEYPLDKIISIKTNRLDLKLNSLAEYALSNNMIFKDVQNGSSMFKDSMIRITPFYKGYSDYVYGKSVIITTTYSGGIKVIQQSNGDGFVENPMYQELGKDYFDDHSPVGDYMDSILDGFDESEMNLDKVTLNFFTLLKGLLSATGQFPALFAAVFSFLPDYFISMIVVSLSLVIILRVIGR